jgi:hypothetical protein
LPVVRGPPHPPAVLLRYRWASGGELFLSFSSVLVSGPTVSDPIRRFARVFEGGGFGVGLTVRELGVPTVETSLPPGVTERPMRLSEALPARARTAVDQARELEHVQVLKAMLAAYEAVPAPPPPPCLVVPTSADPPPF